MLLKRRPLVADHGAVAHDPSREPADPACWNCGAVSTRPGPWCPRCLERAVVPERAMESAPVFEYVRAHAPRAYSRVRGGPTSLGVFGRLVLSGVPVVVAFFAIRNVMRSRGDVTMAFYLVLGVPAVVLAAGCLAVVWRKDRVS